MEIYYFSRTGRSEQIADALAEAQGGFAHPILDDKNWEGAIGYMKAAMAAMGGKGTPAKFKTPPQGEQVAVVFPLWAGTFPPVVRTFVETIGRKNIVAIPTSLGSKLRDREGFAQVIDLVGKEIATPTL